MRGLGGTEFRPARAAQLPSVRLRDRRPSQGLHTGQHPARAQQQVHQRARPVVVVLNQSGVLRAWRDNTVVLARKKEGVSPTATEEPPLFTCTLDNRRVLHVALTRAELVYSEARWNLAKKRKMGEVQSVMTFDKLVAEALLGTLDPDEISFRLRPLPQGVAERELISVSIEIVGDDLFAHLRRLYQQLLPHLSPEGRSSLKDPRTITRTLHMERLGNLLD